MYWYNHVLVQPCTGTTLYHRSASSFDFMNSTVKPENCRTGRRHLSNTEVLLMLLTCYKANSFTSKLLNHLLSEMGLFTLNMFISLLNVI